ncbi:FKBP-TYPE PEPTIDYL-PROLYL CIS-TRANS ISOMERASE [Salix koriyanagi]|uniref:FKBP-TYPE PEPTIDYL-PROLYL CIS-TRANS ISOMERASE n=1 Tax=Salix koriyanagi TaxID=2511006 RepID=A0A9Q1AE82_9ROSI|nr:FKBP-TYPE PEPTIDYL-PROLYL CIS-TRANS ISOMERASE [Salix koriyanagi]
MPAVLNVSAAMHQPLMDDTFLITKNKRHYPKNPSRNLDPHQKTSLRAEAVPGPTPIQKRDRQESRAPKAKKGKSGTGSGSGMYPPPVPLKKSVSDGLKVEFGFSPYSERINGRIAILGLSALFLVELATGKGVINYHTPAIVLLQIYFVVAVAAMYVKYEKEKVSIWPQSASSKK